jgi:hypothetical protein
MRKINYIQLNVLIVLISLAGCATNSGPNALSTGAAAVDSVQSGQQALNAGAAIADTGASQIGLVDILVHRLGVSPQQALGGAGAIFQTAQSSMDPQAFASLSRSIPGMSSMLGAAPASGGLSSMMGSGSTVGSAAALAGSFKQLDLSPDMVGRFIPVVTNYVRQNSGQATADLLQSALGAR